MFVGIATYTWAIVSFLPLEQIDVQNNTERQKLAWQSTFPGNYHNQTYSMATPASILAVIILYALNLSIKNIYPTPC